MLKKIYIILFCLLIGSPCFSSETILVPTPYVNGVNIITGQILDETQEDSYHYYHAGHHDVAGISLQLSNNDWRIGRVKSQKKAPSELGDSYELASFIYNDGCTEVFDSKNHKTAYRYTKNQLLESIEQYQIAPKGHDLYRKECFYWDSANPPRLICRTLENAQGEIQEGFQVEYNQKNQIIKQTIIGNLSGTFNDPFTNLEDAIESYSIYYEYSSEHPELVSRQSEDNNTYILYGYNSAKQCISKMKGSGNEIASRCFYVYDDHGFLTRTIVDDGSGNEAEDLSGVTVRNIIDIQLSTSKEAYGQPLITESKYLNLETHEEVLLEKTVCSYSTQGKLVQQDFYDAEGCLRYSIRMNYDEKGQLISTSDSRGEKASLPTEYIPAPRYDADKQKECCTDKYGNETQTLYDDFGRKTKTIFPAILDPYDHPFQPSTSVEYDICDRIIKAIDGNGHTTSTEYNVRGNPIHLSYPGDIHESFTYYLDGTLKTHIDKEQNKIYYERDPFGRVLKIEKTSPSGKNLETLSYTYKNSSIASISTHGASIHYQYDHAGRQIGLQQETKDGIRHTEYTYDSSGQKNQTKCWFGPHENDYVAKIEEKDAWQQTVGIRFQNAQGQIQKKITSKNGSEEALYHTEERYATNERGQWVRQQETVDIYGSRQLITYDAMGHPEKAVQVSLTGAVLSEIHYRYDANGNKILERHLIKNSSGNQSIYAIAWTYDEQNRITSLQEGINSPNLKCTRYTYHSNGLTETMQKPDGNIIRYTYDERKLLIGMTSSDGSVHYSYGYDEQGRLISIQDLVHSNTIQRSYNAFDELTAEKVNEFTFVNEYDLAGRRTKFILPDGSGVNYCYQGSLLQAVQRLDSSNKMIYQHLYQYHPESGHLIKSQLAGEAGTLNYQHDAMDRIKEISSTHWSETIPDGGMDLYGHMTALSFKDPKGTFLHHFSYTDDHQISSEVGHFNNQFQYDSLRNRIGCNNEKWNINSLNQLISTSSTEYEYDLNGNLISKKIEGQTFNYQYDALNRLRRIEKKNEIALDYTYDPFCRRLSQTLYFWNDQQEEWSQAETEYFLYDGDKEIGKINGDNKICELRILGLGKGAEIGSAISLELYGKTYAPIHDHLGSVRCLIDIHQGSVSEFYRYSAYGLEEIYDAHGNNLAQSALLNPWRFSSKRIDHDTGLIFFGKRYYDPSAGRWVTPDPLDFFDGPNLYAYVGNNPVSQYDLYGLFSIRSIWDYAVHAIYKIWGHLEKNAKHSQNKFFNELRLPKEARIAIDKSCHAFFGKTFMRLLGHQKHEETAVGSYGQGELNDKVRITFIHGILTNHELLIENLEIISRSHGGTNVHYVFRPTDGWTWDIGRCALIKLGHNLGYVSPYAHLLASLWKKLIKEMGEDGTIIHYAHSIGGSDTDRARYLLSPEEQKMIRVITIGSATMIRNQGFQSVINYVSKNDGVGWLDPQGHFRNVFDPSTNVVWKGQMFHRWPWSIPTTDHLLSEKTYRNVLISLGEKFLNEFLPSQT